MVLSTGNGVNGFLLDPVSCLSLVHFHFMNNINYYLSRLLENLC